MNADTSIDFNSSGYAAQLLSIIKNIDIFVSKNPNQQSVFYVGKNY